MEQSLIPLCERLDVAIQKKTEQIIQLDKMKKEYLGELDRMKETRERLQTLRWASQDSKLLLSIADDGTLQPAPEAEPVRAQSRRSTPPAAPSSSS